MGSSESNGIYSDIKQVLKLKPDTKNIVFSGGCAMNICANTVMCEEFPDINFFIDPIAGTQVKQLVQRNTFIMTKRS